LGRAVLRRAFPPAFRFVVFAVFFLGVGRFAFAAVPALRFFLAAMESLVQAARDAMVWSKSHATASNSMISLLLAPAAFGATMLGGLVALRMRDRLHLILGFSAGAVVGVAFFDLLPEAIHLTQSIGSPELTMVFVAAGFLFYLLLDRIALLHAAGQENGHGDHGHSHAPRGGLGALTLVAHSVLDGLAIGFAFQVSNAVGAAVAIAVLTHDFSDGINTMNVVLKGGGSRVEGLRWLLADAIAPALGISAALFFVHLPAGAFGTVLALFAGMFLYLGASDLVPESHHAHPKFLTTAMTVLGAALIYATNAIAS
jgi:ZIP family zinc transporter